MWYPYHALAYLALLLLVSGLIVLFFLAQNLGDREAVRGFFSTIEPYVSTVAPMLAIALIGTLVGRQLGRGDRSGAARGAALVRLQQPRPRSTMWTALLVACNWGAAIAYFFRVWRPTHARVGT